MKLYKFVSYASLAAVSIAVMFLVTTPFMFPGSSVAWKAAVIFGSPAAVLVLLLFLKPVLSRKFYLASIILLAGFAILGTIIGWMAPVISGIFLVACLALYFSSSGLPTNAH